MSNSDLWLDPRLPERFWAKVRRAESGCWEWQAGKARGGYGSFVVKKPMLRPAHRISYLALVGEIPDKWVIDHLCRNPPCVNPAHLEAVTNRENVLRGINPKAVAHVAGECLKGHRLEGANLIHDTVGRPRCRTCRQQNWRDYASDPEFKARRAAAAKERVYSQVKHPCEDCAKSTVSQIRVCRDCQFKRRRAA